MNNSSRYVSIWVGYCKNEHDLESYIAASFSDDGDMINSKFAEDYKIGRINDDFLEHDFFGSINELVDGIDGFSYSDQIIPQLKDKDINLVNENINFAILYYDFKYAGHFNSIISGTVNVKYLGNYEYFD